MHTIAVSDWAIGGKGFIPAPNACSRPAFAQAAVRVRPHPVHHFSEAIMKAILSMALVLGVGGFAGAVDDKAADPVGTWKCEYEIGGQQRTATLTIKKDGDKLTGTMTWPDQKETEVKDLKLKDGSPTFSVVRKLMDNEIPVE